jgi:hypothetical protein
METLLLVCGGALAGALGAWLYFRSARAIPIAGLRWTACSIASCVEEGPKQPSA